LFVPYAASTSHSYLLASGYAESGAKEQKKMEMTNLFGNKNKGCVMTECLCRIRGKLYAETVKTTSDIEKTMSDVVQIMSDVIPATCNALGNKRLPNPCHLA